ncbi:MAG: hypothetical protein P4L53_11095 [Candidatus Obscuribacterales bacterium]|nr:hypothetical protein [Candidatus Obscuribacterales bacterium]
MIKAFFNILGNRAKSEVVDFLAGYVPAIQERKCNKLTSYGSSMSDAETADLEDRVAAVPTDLDSRIKLLGKYISEQYHGGPAKQLRLKHIEWIIVNRPEHVIAGEPHTSVYKLINETEYSKFKSLWLNQVEKKNGNSAVLVNAAHFFFLDEKEVAERFLLAALELNSYDRSVREQLALLYSLWDGHEEQALAHYATLCTGRDSEALFSDLSSVPAIAFEAGQLDRARESSDKVLGLSKKYRKSRFYGEAVNNAHTTLGRLALITGDVEKAKHHLAMSIVDIASATMCSFGPKLDLASELVKAGENASVLEYLDKHELLCGVCHPRAFKVRYRAINGIQDDSALLEHDDNFDDAYLEHQFHSLETREPAQRRKHLQAAIESARSTIKAWSARDPEQSSPDKIDELRLKRDLKIKRYEHLLRRLEALQVADNIKN